MGAVGYDGSRTPRDVDKLPTRYIVHFLCCRY